MALVSVILPTYNRLSRLKQVLAAFEQQRYPRDQFNIIVVSDGSTDGTDEYMRNIVSPLEIKFVSQKNAGPAAARNNGIANADSEYVLFIDDDVIPKSDLIAEHMRQHAEQPDIVVLGPMLTPSDFRLSPWVAWEQAMLEKQYKPMRKGEWKATPRQFYTGNTSLARKFLVTAGGFDERFRRAEDVELAYRLERLGVKFVFHPQAIGYHYAERSFRSWLETPYAYGCNDVIFMNEGQSWIKGVISEEFKERNFLTQALIHLCLDRPRLNNLIPYILTNIANIGQKLRLPRVNLAAYSAIFNMRYYQGVSDQLGGRDHFFTMVDSVKGGN
jgi:GT2 family glycosyltransferase